MAKAMLKYLKKKSSFNRIATWLFEWLIRKKGAASEEEFSTYGVGMQVSYSVGLDEGKIRKYIQDQEVNESIEDKYDTDLSNPF